MQGANEAKQNLNMVAARNCTIKKHIYHTLQHKKAIKSLTLRLIFMAKKLKHRYVIGGFTLFFASIFATTQAQTIYKLKVCGTEVTSDNAADITGAWKKAGKITYNDATKTLTLTNATLEATESDNCIRNEMGTLNIVFEGTNTLNSAWGAGIYNDVNGKMTITGGTAKIKVQEQAGIFSSENSELTITKTNIDTYGYWGISGITGMKNEKLIIDNATVSAFGSWASLSAFASFTLTNGKIIEPTGATWKDDMHAACDKYKSIIKNKYVKITPTTNGVSTTEKKNNNEIKAIYTIEGKQISNLKRGINIIKYNNGSSKITLQK